MADKIRLGFVGANVRANWASQSHFPALLASPDVELTAVCTTKPESAEEARQALGAKLAFHDFRAMVASPAIDAVAVVVWVPLHYEPTKAAIEAGKHVFTEWPLGRTTAEAKELAGFCQISRQHGQNRVCFHSQPPVFARHARGRRCHIPPQKATLARNLTEPFG